MCPGNCRLHATLKSGDTKSGHVVEHDRFPAGHKTVAGVSRNRLRTLAPGEEEPEQLATLQEMEEKEASQTAARKKEPSPLELSAMNFKAQTKEQQATAGLCEMQLRPDIKIDWKILGDEEHIGEDEELMKCPEHLEFKKDIDFVNTPMEDVFFEHFVPSVAGHAALFDEFFKDERAPHCATIASEKIVFNQPEDDDPDWIIKQCCSLMIAAVTEAETGVDNLWKDGQGKGRHAHPNFGRHMPKNHFKAFLAAAPFAFCDKQLWCCDKRDRDWEMFQPCLGSLNEKRQNLFKVMLIVLDESMSQWRPKTTKCGGLPNVAHEPRKPVPLGTQFKNAVECLSGCFSHQDVVQGVERQRRKKHCFVDGARLLQKRSCVPTAPPIASAAAETLRQAEGSRVEPGGWVGGDAWFGSVQAATEVKRTCDVCSAFVVKTQRALFPVEVLSAVLKARHGTKVAGHWVVMRAAIKGVDVRAIACAWSQKGVSHFVTTCGKTAPSPYVHEAKFEDEWGNTSFKCIPRPDIIHFCCECAPLADEHNKARQSALAMEKRWETRNAWFRLVTAVTAMSVVDMCRVYRHNMIKILGEEQEDVDGMQTIQFTDWMCANLREWKHSKTRKSHTKKKEMLERIRDMDGNTNREPTVKQAEDGRNVGNALTQQRFVCRRHLDRNGITTHRTTSCRCKDCHMPLCHMSRIGNDGGREVNCQDEHCTTDDPLFQCGAKLHIKSKAIPKSPQESLWPRQSKRARKQAEDVRQCHADSMTVSVNDDIRSLSPTLPRDV